MTEQFGLLWSSQNTFIAISSNYRAIKKLQYCLGTQATTLCVDFSTVDNRSTQEINKDNHLEFGASFRLLKWLDLDSTPLQVHNDYFINLRKNFGQAPIEPTDFIRNVNTLLGFIENLTNIIDFANKKKQRSVERRKQGLLEFADFVKIQAGPSAFIDEMVKIETDQLSFVHDATEVFESQVFKLLCNINYQTTPADKLTEFIASEINTFTIDGFDVMPFNNLKRVVCKFLLTGKRQ